MNIPNDLKYTKDHEWARVEGDTAVIGITDYAQGELGDIVYVDLPSVGDRFGQNDTFGTIEAVKAAADLYCPLSGEIIEVNEAVADNPDTINKDPYGDGWMIKLKLDDQSALADLMDSTAYKTEIGE